jgi:hypothetical protein
MAYPLVAATALVVLLTVTPSWATDADHPEYGDKTPPPARLLLIDIAQNAGLDRL